jgi:class 3 adenylate cyclase/tetratricopeptide (TPR) repeat protein
MQQPPFNPSAAPIASSAPPFVGRREQLAWLHERVRATLAGEPQLVLVPGEPGIGKTRLLREFRSLAEAGGVHVCYGRCYQDLALPYLPFAESLWPHLISDDAHHRLGGDAEVIRTLLGVDRSPDPASPSGEQDKLRLFLAVTRATLRMARLHPLVLGIDDLHWADRSSLDLFAHLAFAAADRRGRERTPIMLIASYRTTEADAPASRTIARLQREDACHTLAVPGLDESEVDELIEGLGLINPTHQLVASVSATTHGNPLFVQEVVHDLVRQGALQAQGGRLIATGALAGVRLPEQLTAAIASRTRALSDPCRHLLTIAALLGNRFEVAVLSHVSDGSEESVLEQLEEAMQHQLLVSEEQSFQFAHPLIRQTLQDQLSVARRQRLHQQIADRLTRRYGEHRDEHVIEIAHHVVAAGPAAPAETVIAVARPAGDRAVALCAFGDAARFYDAALSVVDATHLLPVRDRAELHTRAGMAYHRDWDPGPAQSHFEQAVALWRRCDDVRGLAFALLQLVRSKLAGASAAYGSLIDVQPLEDARIALGEQDPEQQTRICSTLAQAYWTARQPERADAMARQALAIADAHHDERGRADALVARGLAEMQQLRLREALGSFRDALQRARRSGDAWMQGWPIQRVPVVLSALGLLQEAATVAGEACELAREVQDWGNYSLALATQVALAVAGGDFEAAERSAHDTVTMARRSGYPWGAAVALSTLAGARTQRGEWTAAEEAIDRAVQPGRLFDDVSGAVQIMGWIYRQLIRAHAGALTAEECAQMAGTAPSALGDEGTDLAFLAPLCALIETAQLAGIARAAADPYRVLLRAAERGVVFTTGWVFLVPRILGVAAGLQGDWAAAARHFEAALAAARTADARPELGRTMLDYARMLRARGDAADEPRVRELLPHALAIFRTLAMAPFIAQASALDGTAAPPPAQAVAEPTPDYPAEPAPANPQRTVEPQIILFTDMQGSTEMYQRLGDARAAEVVRLHNAIIRDCLHAHGGTELHHTGDGVMAAFRSASNAIRCAIAVQRSLAEHNQSRPDTPVHVRIGLNAGEPLAQEGSLYGAAVNAAARICAHARPGQVLVADVVRQLVTGQSFSFVDRGRVTLKGFAERFRLYEVIWAAPLDNRGGSDVQGPQRRR